MKGTLGYLFPGRGTLPIVKVPAQEYLRLRGTRRDCASCPGGLGDEGSLSWAVGGHLFCPYALRAQGGEGGAASDRPRPSAPLALCVRSASTTRLRIREPHGIWGGLSEVERRSLTG